MTFKNATGVAVHNIGVGGAAVGGGVLNGNSYSPLQLAIAHAPKLTFIELGTNETAPLPAYFQTDMQSAINQLVAAGSDVVLIGEPPTGVGPGTRPVPAVLAADYTLADTNNVAMVDLSERLISWTSADTQQLTYTADALTVHYNEAGYAEFARTIANALTL